MAHRQNLLDTYSREGDCAEQLRFTSKETGNNPVVQSTGPWGSANEQLAVARQKSCVWHETG